MLKCRAGLLLTALLLCACDHHNKTSQAQAEAGTAAVRSSDSEYTGEQAAGKPPVYPRALPVTDTNAVTSAASSSERNASESTPPPSAASTSPPTDTTSTPSAVSASDTTSAATPPAAASMPDTTSASTSPAETAATTVSTSAPPAAAEEQVVVIDTTLGRIVIEPDDSAAPKTSENFRKLAADGFYNHTTFHRVIPHFIIQGGDPNTLSEDRTIQGKGGPGYTLPSEIKLKHERGAVAMARLPDSVNPGRESNGSQFYICVADSPSLDDQYTVFGHVIRGMDVVDAISNQARDNRDNPINRIEMEVTLEPKGQAQSAGSAANP